MSKIKLPAGENIWFKKTGSGPAVFHIHGSAFGHKNFEKLTPYMSDNLEIIDFDLPGYGESTGYSIEEDTRVITMLHGHAYAEVLLDELGWVEFEPTSSTQCPTCDMNAQTTTGEADNVVGNGTQPEPIMK